MACTAGACAAISCATAASSAYRACAGHATHAASSASSAAAALRRAVRAAPGGAGHVLLLCCIRPPLALPSPSPLARGDGGVRKRDAAAAALRGLRQCNGAGAGRGASWSRCAGGPRRPPIGRQVATARHAGALGAHLRRLRAGRHHQRVQHHAPDANTMLARARATISLVFVTQRTTQHANAAVQRVAELCCGRRKALRSIAVAPLRRAPACAAWQRGVSLL